MNWNHWNRLLYPQRCPICDRVAVFPLEICPSCREQLSYVGDRFCIKCGKSILGEEKALCHDCREGAHQFDAGRILYHYDCVREAIFRFKYEGRREYASFFGKEMARCFGANIKSWGVQAILPVPLYAGKEKIRGFNQARELGAELGARLGLPLCDRMMIREKDTIPQKELTRFERQKNLKKAFKIVQNDVKYETIIIVDDVYTTGSTMDAMAGELKAFGVSNVFFITLSSGEGI